VHEQGPGSVADVGCGPGHVAASLAGLGLDIVGIDTSPALLRIARDAHPDIRFDDGRLSSLPVASGSLLAVVSRHSLIHTPTHLVPAALDEFARVLRPDGLLFLSFFGASRPSAHGDDFDHAVTTAYQFDVDIMAGLLGAAGLTEEARIVRRPLPGERQLPDVTLLARRS
jgi:ubiquinone/menaquinone biosynthesis C-methylase UbiE